MVQDSLLEIRGLYPNPFTDQAAIFYTLTENAMTHITIYNVAGEPLWHLVRQGVKGTNLSVWKGENDSGGRAASGIYIIRVYAIVDDENFDTKWVRACVVR